MAVIINNGFVSINEMRNESNLAMGKNASNAWTYFTKTNVSVGEVAGNFNIFPTGANILIDPDIFDHLVADREIKPPIGPSIVEVI